MLEFFFLLVIYGNHVYLFKYCECGIKMLNLSRTRFVDGSYLMPK
jgi:hypothetical protein